jgi:hypothetical protein
MPCGIGSLKLSTRVMIVSIDLRAKGFPSS